MAVIDEAVLDEKLAELERAHPWSPRTVAKLEALLNAPEDHDLYRVNPLAFARERGIPEREALDLFLHASRLGVLTMDWHLLCPLCGAAVESFASLRALHRHFFCALCNMHTEANLDDFIQVSFTVAPAVRRIRYHDATQLSAEDYFYQCRMTREMHFGALDGPRMLDIVRGIMKVLVWVQPGERLEFSFDTEHGALALAEFHAHTGLSIMVEPDAEAGRLDVVIEESTMTSSRPVVRVGRIEGSIENRRGVALVFVTDHHPLAVLTGPMPTTVLEPFVTGAMLLSNQTFRRLFRSETVQGSEGIGVRDVTVLFTDLKGSTALYERIGDLQAFALVRQHFDRLAEVIADHGGAIVKTIGDAVMASFQRPVDAVRAAFAMLHTIERFNHEHGSTDIVLKIGIHRGPSIAVTLNQSLDYFGHTVNVAARVQGLADADEVYVTDDVYQGDGVAGLIDCIESRDAQLRGIQKEIRVHRAVPRARA